ncbi:MAG: sigma-70 family RNA polymerase sigma factor [Planctomycetota bacterium]
MANQLDANALLAHGRFLRALARDLLGDEHLAEDVVQETWIRALRSGPRKAGSLRPWLASIARNLARDRGRSEGARRARERKVARPEAISPTARFEEQQRVVAIVAELESPYRDVLIQRYFEDLTPTEIGRRLGVPAATVRTRIHRALAMLRARLDAEHGGNRSAWSALLLPLVAPPRSSAPVSLASLSMVGGVVVSKLKYVAVAVLVVALWSVGSRSSDAPPRASRSAEAPGIETAQQPATARVDEPAVEMAARRTVRGRVLQADGSPAAGAVVAAHPYEPDRYWISEAPRRARPRGRVTCDVEGAFETAVEPGRSVLLVAVHGGHAAQRVVRAGSEPREGVEIRLRPTATARLRVVDEAGRPVEGADVTIGPRLFDDRGEPRSVGRTDADGRAVIGGIAIQPYGHGVTVRHPGFAVATRVSAVLPNAAWTIRLVRGESYEGVVLDAERQPVPSARVRWLCEHERFGSGETRTDREGRFRIAHLPPYPCVVFLDGAGRGQGFKRLVAPPHPAELILDEVRARSGIVVDESGAPVPDVRVLALSPKFVDLRTTFSNGISVHRMPERMRSRMTGEDGRFDFPGLSSHATRLGVSARSPFRTVEMVEEGAFLRIVVAPAPLIRGRVVDPEGRPVAHARVVRPGGHDYERYTDQDGRFSMYPLPAVKPGGKTSFYVTRPGYARLEFESAEPEPTLTLRPVGTIVGRLVDPDGNPIVGARIGANRQYVFSESDGRFRVWLPSGGFHLRIQRDGFRLHGQSVRGGDSDQDLGDLELRPRAPARLRGTVVDPTGRPLAGVVVEAQLKTSAVFDGDHQERTDHRGRFEFPSLSEGEVTVEIRPEGFAPYRKAGIALRGEIDVVIELRSALRISGTVVHAAGEIAKGATVELLPDAGGAARRHTTRADDTGRFAFESLADGRYRVVAAIVHEETARSFALATAEAGEEGVRLRLAPPARLSGRLLDVDGSPMTGVRVEGYVEHAAFKGTSFGAPEAGGETDAQGRFRIDGLAGEEVELRFRYAETAIGTAAVLPPTRTVSLDEEHEFRLVAGGAIAGTVFAPDGTRYTKAWVQLAGNEGHEAFLRPDRHGRFRVTGLPPGRYTIKASGHYVEEGLGARVAQWSATVTDVEPDGGEVTVRLRPHER